MEIKMTVIQAEEKMAAALEEFAAPLRERGLKVITRVLYTDKTLAEISEFNPKCIIAFGDIAIGTEDMDRDDYCNYSMCCEIKTGLLSDEEFTKEMNNLDGELEALKDKLDAEGAVAEDIIREITRKQEAAAETAAQDFAAQMRKLRFKMLLGIGVMIAIMLAVIIGIPLLT